jgi:hypothetical protein
MQKITFLILLVSLSLLLGCATQIASPTPLAPTSLPSRTPNPHLDPNYFLTATNVPAIRPLDTPTLSGDLATIVAQLDMGGGGAGFAATIYAQEVTTGKTFHTFLSAGMHGLAVLPTSPPVSFSVQAPGTYVFYARLINAPDEYHYGATGCGPSGDCPSHVLLAIDIHPGVTYHIYIADRAALVPEADQPVTVPWVKK